MKEKLLKGFLLGWIIFHLSLVSLGASYGRLPEWLPGRSIVEFYAHASGADGSYGFFAPSIGMKVRGLFDVVMKDGTKIFQVPLIPDTEREMHIRLGGVFDELTSEGAYDDHFRQPLATSLAAAIFTKYHDAAEVILHVEEFLPVTMVEYREGRREEWMEYYKARFARNEEKREEHEDREN